MVLNTCVADLPAPGFSMFFPTKVRIIFCIHCHFSMKIINNYNKMNDL